MDQERWRRVEELFHAALERTAKARPAFLEVACAADTDLRREVELLLAKEEEAGSFLEIPAMPYITPVRRALRPFWVGNSGPIGSSRCWVPALWVRFIERTTANSAGT